MHVYADTTVCACTPSEQSVRMPIKRTRFPSVQQPHKVGTWVAGTEVRVHTRRTCAYRHGQRIQGAGTSSG